MKSRSSLAMGLDLRSMVELARRRWRVVVGLGVLIPAVSVLISVRQEPRYAASSDVLVKRQSLAASLSPGQLPFIDAPTAERFMETQVQLARVPVLAERVVSAAGLAGQHTPEDLLGSSTVTVRPKSDILVFRVEWPSASGARALAGLYADQFTLYRRELDATELDALAAGVASQLAVIDSAEGRATPLYEDLAGKLRQIQTLQALQTSSAVVVRRADSVTQVGPTSATVAAGGLLLGLMLGGGLAFLLESLDTRVRRSADVAAILGLPVLARVPDPPEYMRGRSALVVAEEPESPGAEAFSFLRTNLSFANAASPDKVIMLCSAVEQEGKSTTISNLAVAFAQAGRRVVLVDLDYRRPTVHAFFSVPRSPGVTEVTRGTVELEHALREVVLPFRAAAAAESCESGADVVLGVLPAGDATRGIDVDAVVDVLDRLRDRADVVLVDAPPLLLVGEALALSARMDALVVVARLNHIRRPMLEELRRAFDAAPVRPVGVVVTAAAEEPGYAHYYSQIRGYSSHDASAPLLDAPEPRSQARPTVVAPNGSGPSPTPPETAPVASRRREALLDAVFASGPQSSNGPLGPSGSPPTVGVRPRRSWAEGGPLLSPAPSPSAAEESARGGVLPSPPHESDDKGADARDDSAGRG